MLTTGLQHPPLASGTYNSALTPLASGTHYSSLATFAKTRHIWEVAAKIAVSDGSNAHHSVPILGTGLWHPPLMSGTYHSALMLTTWLQYSPLGSSAHHSAPALTTRLQRSPLGSSAHHLAPPSMCLQRQPLNSGNIHKSSHIYIWGVAVNHSAPALTTWLQHSPLGSSAHHLAPALTTWLQHQILNFGNIFKPSHIYVWE